MNRARKYLFFVLSLFLSATPVLLVAPASAFAETREFHVVFPIPKVTDAEVKSHPGVSRDALILGKSREISKQLAQQLEKRLKAASVKDFHVSAENFEVKVSIGGNDATESRFTDLLNGPGYVEIRPVIAHGGPDWNQLKQALSPELRVAGIKGETYLWSSDLSVLSSTLVSASMLSADTVDMNGQPAKIKLVAGPNELADPTPVGDGVAVQKLPNAGWRSYVLGPVLQTNRDIAKTTWKMDSVGGYTTTISLRTPVSVPKNIATKIAILVDGELIAILPTDKVTSQFELVPPPALPKPQQRNWARSMAGRFAAYIPIPFGLSKLKSDDDS